MVAPVGRVEGEHLPECLTRLRKRRHKADGRRTEIPGPEAGGERCHVQEKSRIPGPGLKAGMATPSYNRSWRPGTSFQGRGWTAPPGTLTPSICPSARNFSHHAIAFIVPELRPPLPLPGRTVTYPNKEVLEVPLPGRPHQPPGSGRGCLPPFPAGHGLPGGSPSPPSAG